MIEFDLQTAKRVFVSSPYRGNVEKNTENAKMACRFVIESGNIPVAPHIFYTAFLNDLSQIEREIGISAGLKDLESCHEIWAFTRENQNQTEGMKKELKLATELKIPIKHFKFTKEGIRQL